MHRSQAAAGLRLLPDQLAAGAGSVQWAGTAQGRGLPLQIQPNSSATPVSDNQRMIKSCSLSQICRQQSNCVDPQCRHCPARKHPQHPGSITAASAGGWAALGKAHNLAPAKPRTLAIWGAACKPCAEGCCCIVCAAAAAAVPTSRSVLSSDILSEAVAVLDTHLL